MWRDWPRSGGTGQINKGVCDSSGRREQAPAKMESKSFLMSAPSYEQRIFSGECTCAHTRHALRHVHIHARTHTIPMQSLNRQSPNLPWEVGPADHSHHSQGRAIFRDSKKGRGCGGLLPICPPCCSPTALQPAAPGNETEMDAFLSLMKAGSWLHLSSPGPAAPLSPSRSFPGTGSYWQGRHFKPHLPAGWRVRHRDKQGRMLGLSHGGSSMRRVN